MRLKVLLNALYFLRNCLKK